jgi:RNA polymerase sigma-70 factor (ECF subfamily)
MPLLIKGGGAGASAAVSPVSSTGSSSEGDRDAVPGPGLDTAELSAIYARHADFVWRNLRRMGVPLTSLDDAVQDVFLVVHRRRADFAARSEIKTWLFGILLRVAQTHRRSLRRRLARLLFSAPEDLDELPGPQLSGPLELVERKEASRRLQQLLEQLDESKRAMLVLVDLEQLSVPEAAASLGLNLNTAYSRLRAARLAFEAAVAKQLRQDQNQDLNQDRNNDNGRHRGDGAGT